MRMAELFSTERIIPKLRARDKRDVLSKLATTMSRDAQLPVAEIVETVLQTADLPAFGPRAGVALPHALIPGLRRPIASFVRLHPPIDFGAVDGTRTDLVALLLSPNESPGEHLRALAWIARRLRDADVRSLLRASQRPDTMYVVLLGGHAPRVRSCPDAEAPYGKEATGRYGPEAPDR